MKTTTTLKNSSTPILEYDQGNFYYSGTTFPKRKVTKLEAARLRVFGTPQVKKIFDRLLLKFYDAPEMPLPSFLDPHQRDGILHALTRSRSYLAHAPGAGKTCEAIVIANLTILGPTAHATDQYVVSCPPSLTEQWKAEIMRFSISMRIKPSVSVITDSANKSKVDWLSNWIIVPDSMLTKSWVYEELKRIESKKALFVDEASRFKEHQAARTIALFGGTHRKKAYLGLVKSFERTVLMDGSPVMNRPIELWAPITGTAPEIIDFASYEEFGIKYGGPTRNAMGSLEFKHASNEKQLHEILTRNFMHIVTESELDHPERQRKLVLLSKTNFSNKTLKDFSATNLLNASTFDRDAIGEDYSQGVIAKRRRDLGIEKIPAIVKYTKERLENESEFVLLFAWHREVCERLALDLKAFRPGLIMGGTSRKARTLYLESFQRGKRRLLIANIGAMARGHNLQNASRVIFGEYSWSDELNRQAEKRASRKGSLRKFIPCDYLVVPGTIDEVVLKSVMRKAKTVEKVIGI